MKGIHGTLLATEVFLVIMGGIILFTPSASLFGLAFLICLSILVLGIGIISWKFGFASGVIGIFMGFAMLYFPFFAPIALSLLIASLFFCQGITSIVMLLVIRKYGDKYNKRLPDYREGNDD